jgi:hypothetical protein
VSFERKVRLARLPEMRLAYLETAVEAGSAIDPGGLAGINALWDSFNEWRLASRPALGRIDIAAIGWQMLPADGGATATFRAAVPVRGDYAPPPPARTALFPGGALAYCYADDAEEESEAFAAVRRFVEAKGLVSKSGPIQLFKFHYNLDQHPSDCGLLVTLADGRDPLPAPSEGPLHIARG